LSDAALSPHLEPIAATFSPENMIVARRADRIRRGRSTVPRVKNLAPVSNFDE
jgi:hypothetical protein